MISDPEVFPDLEYVFLLFLPRIPRRLKQGSTENEKKNRGRAFNLTSPLQAGVAVRRIISGKRENAIAVPVVSMHGLHFACLERFPL